jgi:hypothetical protein
MMHLMHIIYMKSRRHTSRKGEEISVPNQKLHSRRKNEYIATALARPLKHKSEYEMGGTISTRN